MAPHLKTKDYYKDKVEEELKAEIDTEVLY
jgi:hypothetical protein